MDYITKPTSRDRLRRYSKLFRKLFDVPEDGPFPVLESLERLGDVFEGSTYIVVEDDEMPKNVVACCKKNCDEGFTIEIKQHIYDGAMKGVGAYLGFILHEMAHIFMYELGYTPIFAEIIWGDTFVL